MNLIDIKNTDIREIGKGIFVLTNGAVNLDETLDVQEMHEALDSLLELARELSYMILRSK